MSGSRYFLTLKVDFPCFISKSEMTFFRLLEKTIEYTSSLEFDSHYGIWRRLMKTPILWPPHVKSWLIGEDPDAGTDWGQREKETTEDEMAGWHHWLGWTWVWVNSRFTPGDGDGQGSLVCCDSWGRKELDTTERLNWTELRPLYQVLKIKFSCLKF